MNDDLPKKEKVTVDEDLLDDEDMEYLVVVPVNCVWFNKLNSNEMLGLPVDSQNEILHTLGEMTLKSILGLNKQSYDDVDIAKAYHLLLEEGYTVTYDKNNGE